MIFGSSKHMIYAVIALVMSVVIGLGLKSVHDMGYQAAVTDYQEVYNEKNLELQEAHKDAVASYVAARESDRRKIQEYYETKLDNSLNAAQNEYNTQLEAERIKYESISNGALHDVESTCSPAAKQRISSLLIKTRHLIQRPVGYEFSPAIVRDRTTSVRM